MLKVFSAFSGVGGFERGIARATECEIVGSSEIDKYANQVLKYRFPNIKNYGDVTKIDPATLPDFDLLVGGFPCQAFSVAGKRKGFDDTRGTLFFDIARILDHKRPRHLVLENVKGLLSHDNGKTFQTILKVLTDLGYSVEWQVLNAKDFGVPQNRERIFIVGHLGGFGGRKIFPLHGENPSPTWNHTVRSGGRGSLTKKHSWDIVQLNQPRHSNNRPYGEGGVSPALNTAQGGNRQPKILKVQGDVDRRKTYLGDLASTLAANPTSDNTARALIEGRIRRLTPTECERLMSWPDGWTKYGINDKGETVEMSDAQRYKQCGNGVVSEVVKAIMTRLLTPPL